VASTLRRLRSQRHESSICLRNIPLASWYYGCMFDIEPRTLASANLAFQALLIAALTAAVYFAKNRDLKRHCTILRIAVSLQILNIALVMLPSMSGFLLQAGPLLDVEILLHHGLGLVAVMLWIYVNLVVMGVTRGWVRLVVPMRLALASWLLSFLIGLHVFVATY